MSTAVAEIVRIPRPRAWGENNALVGMAVFLGAWAVFFAGLLFICASLRTAAHGWPPPGLPRLPFWLPLGSTLVLGLSSAALQLGQARLRSGLDALPPIAASLLLGVLFLGLQCALWTSVYRAGLAPSLGAYPSVFWGLTGFHALHVLVGLPPLALVAWRTALGECNAANHLPLRIWAMYWHFVAAVWLVIFASVFVF